MASLYKKVISGKPYWYLREMAWVQGTPRMMSERYLGSAAEIAALLEAREAAMMPERTRHLAFGDLAARWGILTPLGVIDTIDEVVGSRRADAGATVGTYLALAALNRLVDPRSKRAFVDWWRTTAADRLVKVPTGVLDHRRFWDAMHAVTLDELAAIEHRLALRMIEVFGLDISALALDMTNFATYLDSGNAKAPIAQRGRAKQKRSDLRLVGLGLVVTRDGGVPLVSHAYPGNRPDVTQFTAMIDLLVARYTAVATARPEGATAAGRAGPQMTVVFDAGQNSVANLPTWPPPGWPVSARCRPRTARTCSPVPRLSSGGGVFLRRRLAQYWARAGSSGDAVPLTSGWRTSLSRRIGPGRRRCRGHRIPSCPAWLC